MEELNRSDNVDDHRTPPTGEAESGVTRRTFVRTAASVAPALGIGSLLAACGGSTSTTGQSSGGTPKRGGTLRVGLSGGAGSDTLNPFVPFTFPDYARVPNLFDYLVDFDLNSSPKLALAEEITPNHDATEWTIRIKDGVTFHNGKKLTAEDVKYSLQQVVNPKAPGITAALVTTMNAKAIKVLDARTIRVPFSRPYSYFIDTLMSWGFPVVPVGFDPKRPVGTGPFKYVSFSPGQQSTFKRNDDYWQSGFPYVDELIITDYPDETSQVNALTSGSVDLIGNLTPPSIPTVQSSGGQVTTARSATWMPIMCRVDAAPFSDIRVRKALKLVADRKQILESAYGGHGVVGNDLYSIWDRNYNHTIPQREQDIEQAKFLLKQAGQPNLTATFVAAPTAAGATQAVQVFAQQAAAAGIKMNINQVTVTTLFGPNYSKWPFANSYWPYWPYLPNVAAIDLPGAIYNETHFYKAPTKYPALYAEALKTLDATRRKEIAYEMQSIYHDWSGYVIPVFPDRIDANSGKVHGVQESKKDTGYGWHYYDFKRMWLA
jgi:peptide/nickel transport system substrate-binding protein